MEKKIETGNVTLDEISEMAGTDIKMRTDIVKRLPLFRWIGRTYSGVYWYFATSLNVLGRLFVGTAVFEANWIFVLLLNLLVLTSQIYLPRARNEAKGWLILVTLIGTGIICCAAKSACIYTILAFALTWFVCKSDEKMLMNWISGEELREILLLIKKRKTLLRG